MFSRFCLTTLFSLLLSFAVYAQPPKPVVPAPQLDDWGAFNQLEAQLKAANAEPQAIIDAYQKLYENRPKMLPLVAIKLTVNVAEAHKKLGNADKVLEIDDWAIKQYNDAPEVVWLIQHKANALNAQKKYEDTTKLIEENWFPLVRGGQSGEDWLVMYAATAVREAVDAYEALGQSDKEIPLLLKAINYLPALWDDKEQGQGDWRDGWLYNTLVPQLIKSNRADEALSWAKFHYLTASFDKDALARATTSLGRVWGEKEEYTKIRVFSQLQEPMPDAALKNPLDGVALPTLDDKIWRENLARTAINLDVTKGALNRSKVKESIAVLMVRGDFGGAMKLAQRLMKDDPTKPDGALQICRVFKAADLSVRRANLFLSYLEGQAANPIPAFLKEQEAKTPAP